MWLRAESASSRLTGRSAEASLTAYSFASSTVMFDRLLMQVLEWLWYKFAQVGDIVA